jgi:NAD(P)-dependent dehydrogenase (short-subunit alcohol dehydrogenase family)
MALCDGVRSGNAVANGSRSGDGMSGACKGRVAVVTGASRGIGKAVATRLAAEGASIAICARPTPGMDGFTLDQAAAELAKIGPAVFALPFDLANPATDRGTLIDAVEAELGPVDILVNNAAGGGYKPFLEWSDASIQRVLELNFWAPWHLAARVLPGMIERGAGWIVNVSSASAELPAGPPFPSTHPARFGTIYGGSKAFLDRWTASLAVEMQPAGIAVNTLAPQAAAATEVLVAYSSIADYLYEPLDTMAEAALALATADSGTLTGRITYSLELLAELDRPVRDVLGGDLVDGWQPADLAQRIATMAAHARGEIGDSPSNVNALPTRQG